MTLDPLLFLLLVEAIVLLSGGLGYMLYRHGQGKRLGHEPDVFDRRTTFPRFLPERLRG